MCWESFTPMHKYTLASVSGLSLGCWAYSTPSLTPLPCADGEWKVTHNQGHLFSRGPVCWVPPSIYKLSPSSLQPTELQMKLCSWTYNKAQMDPVDLKDCWEGAQWPPSALPTGKQQEVPLMCETYPHLTSASSPVSSTSAPSACSAPSSPSASSACCPAAAGSHWTPQCCCPSLSFCCSSTEQSWALNSHTTHSSLCLHHSLHCHLSLCAPHVPLLTGIHTVTW